MLAIVSVAQPLIAGLGSKDAEYVGGTWADIKQGTEGKFDVSGEDSARFVPNKGAPKIIPYKNVTTLEYGQKAGRRVGATIALGVTTLGIGALPMLFSKKRKHYLSVAYTSDDGKEQGVVIELGKDVTRGTLKAMEARSGKKIEYESEEAKKHVGN